MHNWNAYKYIHNKLAQSRHVCIAACVGSKLWKLKSALQPHSTGNAGSHLHPQGQAGLQYMKTSCVQCSLCQDFLWSATAAWNAQLADMEFQDYCF